MSKPILVSVDFSKPSVEAMKYAIQAAQDAEAQLVIVHAFEEATHMGDIFADDDEELPYVKAQAQLEMSEAEQLTTTWAKHARAAGLDVEVHAARGTPVDVVLDAVATYGAGQVIVGRSRRGGVEAFVLGSVSKTLAKKCPVPLTIVPVPA